MVQAYRPGVERVVDPGYLATVFGQVLQQVSDGRDTSRACADDDSSGADGEVGGGRWQIVKKVVAASAFTMFVPSRDQKTMQGHAM